MGKILRVTPEELEKASGRLYQISGTYIEIYSQLMQDASTMGAAWEGEDNLAFVDQITGFCEELKQMADKLELASKALKQQSDNYAARQEANITQVRKLVN